MEQKLKSGIEQLAQTALSLLEKRKLTLAVGESLTGGLVCAHLVSIPGASAVLRGGVVAYNAQIKCDVLGVSSEVIAQDGTVNPQVATQMAKGVQKKLTADVGLATTGVAGPGSTEGKPPGTVYVAIAINGSTTWKKLELAGSRQEIREQTVSAVLQLLVTWLEKSTLS